MSIEDLDALKHALPAVKPKPPPAISTHRPPSAFDLRSILLRSGTHPGSLSISIPFRDKRILKSHWNKKAPISRAKLALLTNAVTHNLDLASIAPPRCGGSEKSGQVVKSEKPLTKKVRAFSPTVGEAEALIGKFGSTMFTYEPRNPNAHVNPWSQLHPFCYGAVSRSGTKDMALLRLQWTVEAANERLAKLTGEYYSGLLEDATDDDDVAGWMTWELVDVYERYSNRRMALMKELEVLKARDVVGRVGEAQRGRFWSVERRVGDGVLVMRV
ncbi:hypothetical protein TI39_contig5841g00021 [Zymoseptoria brevis]|uniref:Uncharacterized protein n=1 Tax=Zymoseptoria brevis TaxID=1047168 RepID=A0A0F4G8K9_9PEZI|nr:hypothetical protein TI39_contig5841g00021 [Zymoseptoria brevis]